MAYGKIVDGVLVQKQPYEQEGFEEIPDDAICGQLKQGQGFIDPLPGPPEQPTMEEQLADLSKGPDLADKVEEILDHLKNGTPLSVTSTTWLNSRKTIKGG